MTHREVGTAELFPTVANGVCALHPVRVVTPVKGDGQGRLHMCKGAFPIVDKIRQLGHHDWIVRSEINF